MKSKPWLITSGCGAPAGLAGEHRALRPTTNTTHRQQPCFIVKEEGNAVRYVGSGGAQAREGAGWTAGMQGIEHICWMDGLWFGSHALDAWTTEWSPQLSTSHIAHSTGLGRCRCLSTCSNDSSACITAGRRRRMHTAAALLKQRGWPRLPHQRVLDHQAPLQRQLL